MPRLRKRWSVLAGAFLSAALVFLGVHTAITSGGGNGLDQGHWVLVAAVPTSSRVEILTVEGGCHRFDHVDVHYGQQTIAVTTRDKVLQGACAADLSFEPHTISTSSGQSLRRRPCSADAEPSPGKSAQPGR
jgi:hypothetical protein